MTRHGPRIQNLQHQGSVCFHEHFDGDQQLIIKGLPGLLRSAHTVSLRKLNYDWIMWYLIDLCCRMSHDSKSASIAKLDWIHHSFAPQLAVRLNLLAWVLVCPCSLTSKSVHFGMHLDYTFHIIRHHEISWSMTSLSPSAVDLLWRKDWFLEALSFRHRLHGSLVLPCEQQRARWTFWR